MKKRSFVQKVTHFLNGKGFYIALACCVAVIGVSGWYLWRDLSTASQLAAEVGRAETVVVEPETFAEVETAAPQPTDTEPETDPADQSKYDEDTDEEEETLPDASEAEDDDEEEDDEEDADDTEAAALTEEPVTEPTAEPASLSQEAEEAMEPLHGWLWPLDGAVVAAFSSDTLTYNKAMGDWRTHSGIDLAAELGQSVTAACAGTVISIHEDALLGETVVMDCGNGLTVSYSNLAEEVAVSSGEHLSAGDIIGTVGNTAAGEAGDTPWLHFAVRLNEEPVNPAAYLQ